MDRYLFPYIMEDFIVGPWNFVHVGPKRYVLYQSYRDLATKFYNFELRSDDVFLLGFPRSGTTRCQESIWLINNNLDYENAKSTVIDERCPLLELDIQLSMHSKCSELQENTQDLETKVKNIKSSLKSLPIAPSPRFIKTHLPLSLLPPNLLDTTKVVYMTRDPRDVAVSYYFLLKDKFLNDIGFEKFWELFRDGNLFLSPIFEHIKEAWAQRAHPNLLFLTYEETSKDLPATLRRLTDFFGKQYTEERIRGLCEHLSFEKFKTNPSVNGESTLLNNFGCTNDSDCAFIRRGKVGGWKDYFNEELKANADSWMADNIGDTDLPFII